MTTVSPVFTLLGTRQNLAGYKNHDKGKLLRLDHIAWREERQQIVSERELG